MPINVSSVAVSKMLSNFRYTKHPKRNYVSYVIANSTNYIVEIPPINELAFMVNTILENKRIHEVSRITHLLRKINCEPLHFKGCTLGKLLYGNTKIRPVGDIDIYVPKEQLDIAVDCLLNNGYRLAFDKKYNDPSHVVLSGDNFCLEVHHRILHVESQLDETALLKMRQDLAIDNITLTTLTPTGTLLHLLYHQYGHVVLDAPRIMLSSTELDDESDAITRYIDIASLINKYSTEIDWQSILGDLKKQSLSIHFKQIVLDIQSLFPDIFPTDVFEIICNLNYTLTYATKLYCDVKDTLNRHPELSLATVLQTKINAGHIGREYTSAAKNDIPTPRFSIDECSEHIDNLNGTYIIDGVPPNNSKDLSCKFDIAVSDGKVQLYIRVFDNILVFLPPKEPVSFDFDSVCVKICPAEGPYRQCSILFCPTVIDKKLTCKAFESNEGYPDITEQTNPSVEITEDGYVIKAEIGLQFIQRVTTDVPKSQSFFVDVQVNDCDEVGGRRKCCLAFSSGRDTWYDPRCFARFTNSIAPAKL